MIDTFEINNKAKEAIELEVENYKQNLLTFFEGKYNSNDTIEKIHKFIDKQVNEYRESLYRNINIYY